MTTNRKKYYKLSLILRTFKFDIWLVTKTKFYHKSVTADFAVFLRTVTVSYISDHKMINSPI